MKYLQKSKAKDNEQFKWLRDLQQLEDFVSIILNASGKWRKSGNKNIFKENGRKFTLNWWSSNNTLNVRASQDSTEELEKRLNDLIPKQTQNTSLETQNETETECSKRTTRKKTRPKKPEDSADNQTQEQNCDKQITSLWCAINTIKITLVSLSERITTQSREAIKLDHSMSTNQTTLSDKMIIKELQRKVKQLNNENSNLLMQVTELIMMKNYDLAQRVQMKIVKDPSVHPAPEHPPVMECSVTTVTADSECTIQNRQNSRDKSKSGKANQKKNQQRQQMEKQSNASKSESETKQTDNRNQKQQQQQQQSKLELNQDGSDKAEILRMEKEAKPKPKKPTVVLAGDSISKNIKGWLMS